MKINELIKSARIADASAFGNVKDKRAAKILRAAFQELNSQLDSVSDGNLAINGLGRFTVRSVKKNENGEASAKRRVVFHGRST